jgi:hypothetical protein
VKTLREHPSATAAPSSEAVVLSYYRRHARQCQIYARNAPNEKQRAALQKMVPVWSDFAVEHERMIRESATDRATPVFHHSLKGWM